MTLTIQTFFKAKKHIVKIPPVGVKVKFCREKNFFFFTGCWKFEVRGQVIEYNNNFFFFFKNFVENKAENFTRRVFVF